MPISSVYWFFITLFFAANSCSMDQSYELIDVDLDEEKNVNFLDNFPEGLWIIFSSYRLPEECSEILKWSTINKYFHKKIEYIKPPLYKSCYESCSFYFTASILSAIDHLEQTPLEVKKMKDLYGFDVNAFQASFSDKNKKAIERLINASYRVQYSPHFRCHNGPKRIKKLIGKYHWTTNEYENLKNCSFFSNIIRDSYCFPCLTMIPIIVNAGGIPLAIFLMNQHRDNISEAEKLIEQHYQQDLANNLLEVRSDTYNISVWSPCLNQSPVDQEACIYSVSEFCRSNVTSEALSNLTNEDMENFINSAIERYNLSAEEVIRFIRTSSDWVCHNYKTGYHQSNVYHFLKHIKNTSSLMNFWIRDNPMFECGAPENDNNVNMFIAYTRQIEYNATCEASAVTKKQNMPNISNKGFIACVLGIVIANCAYIAMVVFGT